MPPRAVFLKKRPLHGFASAHERWICSRVAANGIAIKRCIEKIMQVAPTVSIRKSRSKIARFCDLAVDSLSKQPIIQYGAVAKG
jgi:hypothetical protein